MEMWQLLAPFVQRGEEDEKIELKQSIDLSSKQGRAEFARDISAIANTDGPDGFLVVGVVDKRHRTTDNPTDYLVGFQCKDRDELRRCAIAAVRRYVKPPPRIRLCFCEPPVVPRPVLIVKVPESHARPHVISRAGHGIEEESVWVRAGASCVKASMDEIKDMIRRQRRVVILNFSHPLTDEVREDIRLSLNALIEEVYELQGKVQFHNEQPFARQARQVLDELGFTPSVWQKTEFVVGLPEFAPIAGVMLVELHARTGHFPYVFRRRRAAEGPGGYVWAETIDLQEVRESVRAARR